jgi:putative RNA 2'-phosphotransferase
MTDLKGLSKFLALMLRHKPEEFGLTLDAEGYADISAVWSQVQRHYPNVTPKDFYLWLESEKGQMRYEVRENRVRARYGHSAIEIAYERVVPPEILYHGTTQAALPLIRKEGLTSQKRQHVHLSTGTERAEEVAGRHGNEIVLLKIRALDAHHEGIEFYHPEPRHYLVKQIPPEYIDFPKD